MSKRTNSVKSWSKGTLVLLAALVVFVIPFVFIFLTASKGRKEASLLEFSIPKKWLIFENVQNVFAANDFMLVRAFINSALLTFFSVLVLVVFTAFAAWVVERRGGMVSKIANALVLSGLIIPPAVVPTIFLMQGLGIYGTFPSMVAIEVAFGASFTMMIFKSYISTIPRELDEAAIIDGASSMQLLIQIILPLLKPVIVTAVILESVFVFNDFVNPLYFLPGEGSETVQLTLFNFSSQNQTDFNLLFMDILLITVPMVILFAIFNNRIVAGMTSGSVKG